MLAFAKLWMASPFLEIQITEKGTLKLFALSRMAPIKDAEPLHDNRNSLILD